MMATIDEVHQVCIVIQKDIATINQRCKDCHKKIEGHQKTLYGENGTRGIVARINVLSGESKDKKEWLMRIASPVIASLITGAILGLIGIWAVMTHGGK